MALRLLRPAEFDLSSITSNVEENVCRSDDSPDECRGVTHEKQYNWNSMAHRLICNGCTDRRRFGGRFFYCPDCDFHFADPDALPLPEGDAAYGADYYKRGSSPLDWPFRVFTLLEQKHILSVVQGCHRVLDIGCGSGWMVERLQQHGAEAYGVDTSPAVIALAAGKVDPSRLRCGTLASARFERVSSTPL